MRLFVALGCVAGLLAGCGSKAEEETAPADAVASAVASTAASSMGIAVSTADLPAFVVLPDDARALQRMNTNDSGQKGGLIVVETKMSPAEVLAFYRDVFAKNGMKVAMETASGDGAMLMGATEGEAQALNIIISPGEEGKTSVAITHGEKQG